MRKGMPEVDVDMDRVRCTVNSADKELQIGHYAAAAISLLLHAPAGIRPLGVSIIWPAGPPRYW